VSAKWKAAAKLRALTADLDLENGDFVMLLVSVDHVDGLEHETIADVAAAELTGTGYARETVTWQAPTVDEGGSARAVADDVTFGPMTLDKPAGGWYIAVDGPDDAGSDLLWYGTLDELVVVAETLVITSPLGGLVSLA
jgi:hypothetical protein